METTLLIQYIILAVLLLAACIYIVNVFRKKFGMRRKNGKENSCDSDCGCG